MVYVYVLLFGIGFGTLQPLRAEVMAQRFGGPAYGQVLGVQGIALALATAGGPLTAGIARDASGSYVGVFLVVSALYFVSSALMLYAGRTFRPRTAQTPVIEYESSAG
jgi:MFS family permease